MQRQAVSGETAAGTAAISNILDVTERRVGAIAARTEAEARRICAGAVREGNRLTQQHLQSIAVARVQLTERASALAVRFEGLLDLLDQVEADLTEWMTGAGGPDTPVDEASGRPRDAAPPPASDAAAPQGNARFFAVGTGSPRAPAAQAHVEPGAATRPGPPFLHIPPLPTPEAGQEPGRAPRKRRWWKRFLRDAA